MRFSAHLSEQEEALVSELNLNRQQFLGHSTDQYQFPRGDSYRLIQRATIKSAKSVLSQIDAIELRKRRFGNQMIGLANALVLASRLNIRKIVVPKNPILKRRFVINGVRFTQSASTGLTLYGSFFKRTTFAQYFEGAAEPIELFDLFRKALVPLSGSNMSGAIRQAALLRWKGILKFVGRDLTIHIRSGDIFSSQPNPNYWQPPLWFYVETVMTTAPGQVTLVIEDWSNPVISALVNWLHEHGVKHRVEDGSLTSAIVELATARHLVAGRGSFIAPIAAISGRLRRLTVFGESRFSGLQAVKQGQVSLQAIGPGSYQPVMSPWANSDDQRRAMLTWSPIQESES